MKIVCIINSAKQKKKLITCFGIWEPQHLLMSWVQLPMGANPTCIVFSLTILEGGSMLEEL
jgi:hypothetical protein